jgi:hypothetical protein
VCCRLGKHFPRNPHSRDAAAPFFGAPQATNPNPNQLCGGVVSGNFAAAPSNGTDRHTDDRFNFRENEAAIDYSASFLCALSAYADMPAGPFSLVTCLVTHFLERTALIIAALSSSRRFVLKLQLIQASIQSRKPPVSFHAHQLSW